MFSSKGQGRTKNVHIFYQIMLDPIPLNDIFNLIEKATKMELTNYDLPRNPLFYSKHNTLMKKCLNVIFI